jgi:hypothetical protein
LSLFLVVPILVEAAITDRGHRAFGQHGTMVPERPAAGRDEAGLSVSIRVYPWFMSF